jgi:exocyst complex component 3
MLDTSKSYPEQLVAALRIVEREEMLDEDWAHKKEETGFAPPDRPKNWRIKCMEAIKKIVTETIYGCRVEERNMDEKWFSKHLGNICSRSKQDLEIVKKLCEPCFPPFYKIFDFYVSNTHVVLSDYLKQLIDQNQLKEQEFYILLSWQDTYKSEYFMGSPMLNYDTSKLPDLLDDTYYSSVLNSHIDYTKRTTSLWLNRAMETNYNDWINNKKPLNIDGQFESNLPNDLNTMLIQQLDLINYANDDRFEVATLKLLVGQLEAFTDLLRNKINEFKVLHYKNQDNLKNNFTIRMVATSNDCFRLKDYFLYMRDKYDKTIDDDDIGTMNDQYHMLGNKIMKVGEHCLDIIIEDMQMCLDEHYFKILLTREWLTNDNVSKTIIETSQDYMQELFHLRDEGVVTLLYRWHNRIKVEYMKGFLQNLGIMSKLNVLKKLTFNDPNEKILFCNKIKKEVLMFENWFKSQIPQSDNKYVVDFDVLTIMSDIIKEEDYDFIGVPIGELIKKHPDFTNDMLYALICLRGDISKKDYKEVKFNNILLLVKDTILIAFI